MNMRVLQINATYGYTSTGTIVYDIGDLLKTSGDKPFFAFQRAMNPPKEQSYRIGNIVDWKLHALFSRILGQQSYYSRFATKKLIKWMDSIKPDIVHLHNLHSNYININMVLSYLCKNNIPTVITLHDCWYFTGKCFHYIDIACDKFMNGCGNCPKLHSEPISWLFDKSAKTITDRNKKMHAIQNLRVVGCSDWICNEAKKGFLRDVSISRIYNGVDTSVFHRYVCDDLVEKLNLKNKRVVLGIAEKWFKSQNYELLRKLSDCDNENTVYILLGMTEEYKKKSRDFRLPIYPIGFVSNRKEMAYYYSCADVFVNLTHADTSPTVNMESICCGTPVITYDVGGSSELVLPGCGLIIEENNIHEMISAIHNFNINDKNFVSECGKSHFDKNKCYIEYIALYRDLLEEMV